MSSNETSIYVDSSPDVSTDDIRRVAAHIIEESSLVRPGYQAWSVDDDNIASIAPGAQWAIDIQNLREPELSKLASEVRDALLESGLVARLEIDVPDLSGT